MRQFRNIAGILLLLFMLGGCEFPRFWESREVVFSTVTINGQEYKESAIWGLAYRGGKPNVELAEKYKLIYFNARLEPEKEEDNSSYSIDFFISANDLQLRTNHPYKIDFYKDENIDTLYYRDIMSYFSKNASEILSKNADGIAYIASSTSEKRIPLKGEFVLDSMDSQTHDCSGYYSLSTAENTPEKFIIKGKFRAIAYLNKY